MHSISRKDQIKQEVTSSSESETSPLLTQVKRKRETSDSDESSSSSSYYSKTVVTKTVVNNSDGAVISKSRSKTKSFSDSAAIKKMASQAEENEKELIEFYIQEAIKERDMRFEYSYRLEDKRVENKELTETIAELLKISGNGLSKARCSMELLKLKNEQADNETLADDATDSQKNWARINARDRKRDRELKANQSVNLNLTLSLFEILQKCTNLTCTKKEKHPILALSEKLTETLKVKSSRPAYIPLSTALENARSKSTPCSSKIGGNTTRSSTRSATTNKVVGDEKYLKARTMRFSINEADAPTKEFIEPEHSSLIEIEIPSPNFNKHQSQSLKDRQVRVQNGKQVVEFRNKVLNEVNLSRFEISENSETESAANRRKPAFEKEADVTNK